MNKYNKKFYVRTVAMFFVLLLGTFFAAVRILQIISDEKYTGAAANQSSAIVELYSVRGDIYDTNMVPLTNVSAKDMTVFLPTPSGIEALINLVDKDVQTYPLSRLYSKKAVLVDCVGNGANGTVSVNVPQRYGGDNTAAHLIGYLNAEGRGVAGIEKGCDDLLYTGNSAVLRYSISAAGNALGVEPETELNNSGVNSVVLTVDSRIQQIAENQLKKVSSGAVLITESGGEIRAMASAPVFNQRNPVLSLQAQNSPFLNRALTNYSVGSVFKILTAAAALDSGFTSGTTYNCTGKTVINGVTLFCHEKGGHGEINMQTAVAQSCNCYFYSLALQVGAERIYATAEKCGFEAEHNIGAGLLVPRGTMPEKSALLRSDAALANLAIGQGELLLSPAAVSTLYMAVVNEGVAVSPGVLKGTITQKGYEDAANGSRSSQIMSASAANTIKNLLVNALREGTGAAAYSEGLTSGGKTATAQTGQKVDSREKNNGWFCGFLEKGPITYTVVIMTEDCDVQNVSCAEIFKEICEQVNELS